MPFLGWASLNLFDRNMNNWFQFKEFKIIQEQSAMKVGTDGVLLGAWANTGNVNSILDAGTGTGLIAIMMAQRTDATITGIDIEAKAATEASANASNSPWGNRINIINISLQELAKQHQNKFDLVISNPPFFTNSKKPLSNSLAIAKHNHLLTYPDLLNCSARLLSSTGRLALIIPADAVSIVKNHASNEGLFLHREAEVKPNSIKKTHRAILEFGRSEPHSIEKDIIMIHKDDGSDFTEKYKEMTRAFYLHF